MEGHHGHDDLRGVMVSWEARKDTLAGTALPLRSFEMIVWLVSQVVRDDCQTWGNRESIQGMDPINRSESNQSVSQNFVSALWSVHPSVFLAV